MESCGLEREEPVFWLWVHGGVMGHILETSCAVEFRAVNLGLTWTMMVAGLKLAGSNRHCGD
jgi:hypothetical protein